MSISSIFFRIFVSNFVLFIASGFLGMISHEFKMPKTEHICDICCIALIVTLVINLAMWIISFIWS